VARDQGGLALDDPLVFLSQPDSVVLTRAFARRRGLAVGDAIVSRSHQSPARDREGRVTSARGPPLPHVPRGPPLPHVPRGSPSTCMAMIPRMISDVPEAMLAARAPR